MLKKPNDQLILGYPMVNKHLDPENDQCFVETSQHYPHLPGSNC